jgi:4-diphosphocytidyl-2-C-methyl-D-erythritol kinase
MIVFPNAKVNLGLRIMNKREDGFHDIETIFYPVEITDILEIIPSRDGILTFNVTGLPVPGDPDNNLCLRAYRHLSSVYQLPPVNIHLHKVIPMGAGLGGGSSDGAFTLMLLNDMFGLGMTDDDLMDFARPLGSDCAFFIRNAVVFADQKGDRFSHVALDLSAYRFRFINPGIHVNTAEAYAMIDSSDPNEKRAYADRTYPLTQIIQYPVEEWKTLLKNEFELPVFSKFPELKRIKQQMYDDGALYAAMSGSGSTIFGIFKK